MALSRTTELFLSLACVLATGAVAAQPAESGEAVPADARDQVRALTDEARTAFKAGEFDRAAEHLERAILIFPDPILYYNLGRARQSARRTKPALVAYRKYLELKPDAADRGAIAALIVQLELELEDGAARREQSKAQQRRTTAPAVRDRERAPAPAAQDRRGAGATVWPWLLAGAGAVTVGAGTAVWLTARSKHDEAVAERNVDRAVEAQDEAESRASLATVLVVGGSVLAASGVAWGIWSSSAGTSTNRSSLALHVGAARLLVGGRFD
jgi:tetratricopeptide (TPR) repeat protein